MVNIEKMFQIKKFRVNFKFTSLEYGIRETISWFINNYETCRK